MITIPPRILRTAKVIHVVELSKQMMEKLDVIRIALRYINLPNTTKNIDDFKIELRNLKIDFGTIKSSTNWFLKPKKKNQKTIVESYDTLYNFFDPSNHKQIFDLDIIKELERCIQYFTKAKITGILSALPKELIDVQVPEYEQFSKLKNAAKERGVRKRFVSYLINYSSFRSKTKRYDAYELTKNLQVEACLYCNRGYINTISNHGKVLRPELDHFFAQSIFPILSLSFYNLIPSCHACNSNLKGKSEFNLKEYFHPYLNSFDNFGVVFKYRPNNAADFYPGIDDHLKVKLITSYVPANFKTRIENNLSKFKVNEIYTSHESLIKELKRIKQHSNRTYLESIRTKVFVKKDGSPRFTDQKQIYQGVMLNYWKPIDYYKRPLAKFTKDLCTDLKLIP